MKLVLLALAVALLAMAAPALAQMPSAVPLLNPPLAATPAPAAKPGAAATKPVFVGPYRVINWEELVPAGWDPMKDLKGLDFSALNDSDPRTLQLMKRMREVWDNAPANKSLAGMTVRIPGFVVPLEDTKDGLKEFLLVPYFGACVHSPPPPANQIIHVVAATPAKGLRSMDAVWISGRMTLDKTDSYMGMAGYRIEAQAVAPYQADKR